jgi:3'(2'), 5'-bisphosphate nucleotidase
MQEHTPKVFGIGLSKTGTTSLARALGILGYKTRDFLGVTSYIAEDLSSVNLEEIDANDAFTDTPIPSFYKQLDARYPNSKFILTTRDMDAWLLSCKKQFTKRMVATENEATTRLHTDLYGCFEFDPEKYASGYTRFANGVLEYFKDRPHDLLVTDICGGENWDSLCTFLGKPVPDIPFPLTNVTAIQWMDIQNIVSLAKQAGQEIRSIYQKAPATGSSRLRDRLSHWLRGGLGSVFAKPGNPGHRDYNSHLQKATRVSSKIILAGLKKTNPAIPVISPASTSTPFTERMKWGYIWLVDPLDGEDAFINHNGTFTVNIALIEGGRPVWGIIYSPEDDTVYYAKGASGSFKITGNNNPEKLVHKEITDVQDNNIVVVSGDAELSEHDKEFINARVKDFKLIPTDRITALRMLFEGKAAMYINLEPTMEWQTAAADAIIRPSGKRVYDYKSSDKLLYNKENLINDSFIAI